MRRKEKKRIHLGFRTTRSNFFVGPFILQSKRKFGRGEIPKAEYDSALKEGLFMLKDGLKCRQFEFGDPKIQFSGLIKEFNDILN